MLWIKQTCSFGFASLYFVTVVVEVFFNNCVFVFAQELSAWRMETGQGYPAEPLVAFWAVSSANPGSASTAALAPHCLTPSPTDGNTPHCVCLPLPPSGSSHCAASGRALWPKSWRFLHLQVLHEIPFVQESFQVASWVFPWGLSEIQKIFFHLLWWTLISVISSWAPWTPASPTAGDPHPKLFLVPGSPLLPSMQMQPQQLAQLYPASRQAQQGGSDGPGCIWPTSNHQDKWSGKGEFILHLEVRSEAEVSFSLLHPSVKLKIAAWRQFWFCCSATAWAFSTSLAAKMSSAVEMNELCIFLGNRSQRGVWTSDITH